MSCHLIKFLIVKHSTFTTMIKKLSFLLDAFENNAAPKAWQIFSAFIWLAILAAFGFICLFFLYVFAPAM